MIRRSGRNGEANGDTSDGIRQKHMDMGGEILEHAKAHFDSAGVAVDSGGAILVLGLESTKEQDLDRMTLKDGRMRLHGWTDHVKPKMIALMDFIEAKGFSAEPLGWWGYPSGGTINLKRWAVMAALGYQGKNTVFLDPKVGHRIRLAGMWTDAPLTPHVAQNMSGRSSAIDGRTTRHPGYALSQRIRKRVEEVFGWMKTVGGFRRTRYRGLDRTGLAGYLVATAYNLVRLSRLLAHSKTVDVVA